jgi:hypothetical protein
MLTMRSWVVVLVLVLGCKSDKTPAGSGSAASGSAAAPTPAGDAKPACALLTAAEIIKVVGNPVKDGEIDGTFFCKYLPIDPPGYDPNSGKPPPPRFMAHTFYARGDNNFTCDNVMPKQPTGAVGDLGDRAAWERKGVGWDGELVVCKGPHVVSIDLSCASCNKAEDHLPKLVTLARMMLDRL